MKFLAAIFLVLPLAVRGQQTQPPAQLPASEAPKLAVVEGRVLNSKTGEPVRRARVILSPAGGPTMAGPTAPRSPAAAPYAASTDAEGKFRIDAVDPGNYRLSAERQGFLRQEYGSRQFSMMGSTLKLAAAQEMKSLEMKMIPQAVIVGRVFDDEGEPLAKVSIQVMRRQYLRGKSQLVPRNSGMTTDNGEFRIADLEAGQYWVVARLMRMGADVPARNSTGKPEEEYVATYYPGTPDSNSARAIDLTAGQEMQGVDVRMQKSRVYRIRGKVMGSAAQPSRTMRLILMPRESNGFGFFGGGAMMKEDGTFEIAGVQPGSYYVSAMPMQPGPSASGRAAVEVASENVENVIITVGGGAKMTGTIRIDGEVRQVEQSQGKKVSFAAMHLMLLPLDGIGVNSPNARVSEDGSFLLENISADRYRVNVMNLPQGTWLKSVLYGDQEVPETGLEISAGMSGQLQVVLGVGTGSLTGSIQDAKQQPAPGGVVTLVPDPMKEGRFDLFRISTSDQSGQFTMQGIPPGNYKLFAWEEIDPGRFQDPVFLKQHESKAQRVTVKVDSQQQVTLTQIPTDSGAR